MITQVYKMRGNPEENALRAAAEEGHLGRLAMLLESYLGDGFGIDPDGTICRTRHLVARLDDLKIEIRSDEHAPPHFHVTAKGGIDCSFAIDDGRKLKGDLSSVQEKKIKRWYIYSRPTLIKTWDETRPDGCEVGAYRGP
jgi:hypothetical protein